MLWALSMLHAVGQAYSLKSAIWAISDFDIIFKDNFKDNFCFSSQFKDKQLNSSHCKITEAFDTGVYCIKYA